MANTNEAALLSSAVQRAALVVATVASATQTQNNARVIDNTNMVNLVGPPVMRRYIPKFKARKIIPLEHGSDDNWTWSKYHRSKKVVLSGINNRTAHFHPDWSRGTAGVLGKRPLNNGRFYWELHVSQRVFGTSIMFGIGTRYARLHVVGFSNVLGEDANGWGLSHKGVLWHNGLASLYTKRFKENQSTKVGLLFDGIMGTLTYYKDGKCLGIAFTGLDQVKDSLYPIVCSTASKTEMTLKCTRYEFVNLQERCRAVIMKSVTTNEEIRQLKLPAMITRYLSEGLRDMEAPKLQQVDNYNLLCDF